MRLDDEIRKLKEWSESEEGKRSLEKQAKEFLERKAKDAAHFETSEFMSTYHKIGAHLVENGHINADEFHYNPESFETITQQEFDNFIDSLLEKREMIGDTESPSIGYIIYNELIVTWCFGQGTSITVNLKADVNKELIKHLESIVNKPSDFVQVPHPKETNIDDWLESVGFKNKWPGVDLPYSEFRNETLTLIIKLRGDGIYCYTAGSEDYDDYLEMHLNFSPEPWLLKVILEKMNFI